MSLPHEPQAQLEAPPKSRRKRRVVSLGVCALAAAMFLLVLACNGFSPRAILSRIKAGGAARIVSPDFLLGRETVWQRPFGMAPQAFSAYLRACRESGISPQRIGQTIGDHPRSVGYHKRDGILKLRGENIEYCAAVDLGAFELPEWQRQKFLRALARNGFAAWYRSGPKWKNGEHIHAIYASLPMKPQLRGQVLEWLRDRRVSGAKPHAWETQLRRRWRLRRA